MPTLLYLFKIASCSYRFRFARCQPIYFEPADVIRSFCAGLSSIDLVPARFKLIILYSKRK